MVQMNYSYLRPKKAAWLRRMYDSPFELRQELEVWRGKNATILPLREVAGDTTLFGRGGVVAENEEYVSLSGIPNRIDLAYTVENARYRDEKVVYCGFLVNHWGHFLVEAVTRLWYALEGDSSIDKYVFFLGEGEEREISGNYREFFKLLKIWDKIEVINTPTTYREVVVPQIAFRCMGYYSQKYLDLFDYMAKNVVPEDHWKPIDKIYFTRSHFAKENGYEFGLDSLDDYFARNGFTILAPEKLPLGQMIYYLRNAKEVASMSGSTPHNMLFAGNGQKLTILERLVMNDDHQVCINRMRQLDVTAIDASFHLYPVDFCGPYFLGYNDILERYTMDHGMVPPQERFTSKAYRDRCFKQYMRSYHENYQYRWFMEPWYAEIADSIYEAYQDSYPLFREYLDGEKPFLRSQYFQVHYIKQAIKRLLRRGE